MYKTLLLNADELCLKGRNQKFFWQKLIGHIRAIMKVYHQDEYSLHQDDLRYVLSSANIPFSDECLQALTKVPGLHSFHLVKKLPLDFLAIMPAVQEELAPHLSSEKPVPLTFKVASKRSNKKFPLNSYQISREIGHQVLEAFPSLKVDVHHPSITIKIKVLSKGIYLSTRSLAAVGGLPAGSSGHALTLLSGGFDSPVASYQMFKRGLRQSFVFFHSYPFVGEEVVEKVTNLVKVLSHLQVRTLFLVVPFGEVQSAIAKECKPAYRTLLFRRYMIETASLLAKNLEADALITGDSIGQVASQTIFNMNVINRCTEFPILRPLLGLNKSEIILLAKKIGTHDISILPQDDACSLLADKNPVIKPHQKYWDSFGKHASEIIGPLIQDCISKTKTLRVDWQGQVHPTII